MARQFNGTTDKIQWNSSTALIKQGVKYTHCAWLLADSTSASSHVAFETGTNTNLYVTQLGRSVANWRVLHKSTAADLIVSETNGVTAGQWAHVLGTWDGTGTVTLYRDGISRATGVATDMLSGRAGVKNSLGFSFDGAGEFFGGRIADVAVWQEVLSAPEILQLAKGIKRPNEIRPWALVAFYPLNGSSLHGTGRYATPAVIVSGTSVITEPSLITTRPTKLMLPYAPYTSIRPASHHFNPIRSARRR